MMLVLSVKHSVLITAQMWSMLHLGPAVFQLCEITKNSHTFSGTVNTRLESEFSGLLVVFGIGFHARRRNRMANEHSLISCILFDESF